jgi:hypothetical protein
MVVTYNCAVAGIIERQCAPPASRPVRLLIMA